MAGQKASADAYEEAGQHENNFKILLRLEGRYYQVNDKYYCEADKNTGVPTCSVCGDHLTGEFVNINGKLNCQCLNNQIMPIFI